MSKFYAPPVKAYPISWHLTDLESFELLKAFSAIETNPYRNPKDFLVEALSCSESVPFFSDAILGYMEGACREKAPAFYIKGLPVEKDLPVFDNEDPLADKYRLKNTFVCEALLAVAAFYTRTEIVAFSTINNGDLFHDIYMKESLKNTASQKSMVSFGFHYDMGFKADRPDWANLFCLRSSPSNRVSTSVCRNMDIIDNLSSEELRLLAQPIFSTPEEVVSLRSGEVAPTPTPIPIYFPEEKFRFKFFEGRTKSENLAAQSALDRLCELCHEFKMELTMSSGDMAIISNNHCAHCREVIEVADLEGHKKRWLIKTYNRNTDSPLLSKGSYHLSNQ